MFIRPIFWQTYNKIKNQKKKKMDMVYFACVYIYAYKVAMQGYIT